MTAQNVGIGIIGGGLMGREIAAAIQRWPALVDHPVRPRLTAVCDINPAALSWFDQIDTVSQTTTDYAELLSNPDVDVVYVAVRHDLHEQIYTDVIRAGKDLLAEKPFGIDTKASDLILSALAEHPESFVRCSSEMPFFPGAQRAIDYVRSGAAGPIIEVRSAFLHSSDLDESKPINWKRQAKYCGEAGVMNDLGMHAWHVPLRLGWEPESLTAVLQNLVPQRPGPTGELEECDTWENATVWGWVDGPDGRFPLTVETKRIAPGNKNTWVFEVIGKTGGVRFATSNPKRVEVLSVADVPGVGREQGWTAIEAGSQSVWPTVTGGIFETGFSDAILQMWAVYLAERSGELGDRFGAATPQEAARTHRLYDAALAAGESGRWTSVIR
ncbi:Gfo/Idh/MocA family protein [Microbacterium sp. ASV49]|uniref:Gfo/Idh/MocA family oxidoreductase n=1 Tax=Microbacterium candidum TaxID=3041922 RepID=A0ABT7MW95_9MICO|nr:Gfo/Idh/MocA family oxidoreductase [Microbacterium sp. ASV49]MDL9978729.1 Gfo/Idh/MocA family oxidoreductase [Microbacterium sp. ASV49]